VARGVGSADAVEDDGLLFAPIGRAAAEGRGGAAGNTSGAAAATEGAGPVGSGARPVGSGASATFGNSIGAGAFGAAAGALAAGERKTPLETSANPMNPAPESATAPRSVHSAAVLPRVGLAAVRPSGATVSCARGVATREGGTGGDGDTGGDGGRANALAESPPPAGSPGFVRRTPWPAWARTPAAPRPVRPRCRSGRAGPSRGSAESRLRARSARRAGKCARTAPAR
jgi:hypothetical protein